VLGYNNSFVL